jgi:hypothetical protein
MVYPFESLRTKNGQPPPILLPGAPQMKHAAAALAASVLLAVPGSAVAASCRIPGGRTIASGRVAKLLSVPTPQGPALYACTRRSGRKVALDIDFSDARLAGRWVAWQRPGRPGRWRIAVHDLRTGRERLVDGHVAARSLRLTVRGSVVWAQQPESGTETPLYANETTTGGRLLDGGNVDPTSVKLAGRRVTWFRDDVMYSALVR